MPIPTKSAARLAMKTLDFGSVSRRKYAAAKDTVRSIIQLYVGGNLVPSKKTPGTESHDDSLFSAYGDVVKYANAVMKDLDEHGPSIVPHLIDNDENDGELLRRALKKVKSIKSPMNTKSEEKAIVKNLFKVYVFKVYAYPTFYSEEHGRRVETSTSTFVEIEGTEKQAVLKAALTGFMLGNRYIKGRWFSQTEKDMVRPEIGCVKVFAWKPGKSDGVVYTPDSSGFHIYEWKCDFPMTSVENEVKSLNRELKETGGHCGKNLF